MLGMRERGNPLLRSTDRIAGIPLVLSLWPIKGLLRGMRRHAARKLDANDENPSFGFLIPGAIGDLVLSFGPIADVRKHWPNSEIFLFVSSANAAGAKLAGFNPHIVTIPISSPWESLRILRQHPVHYLFDLGPWPRINALLAAFSAAHQTKGFRSKGQARHFLFDQIVDYSSQQHFIDNVRMLVNTLGVQSTGFPALQLIDQPLPAVTGAPYAVLHPWPGGYKAGYKMWSEDRWLEIATRLASRGIRSILTGGRDDIAHAERMCHNAAAANVSIVNLAGVCSLAATAATLKSAALVISVNTGILHIAAASGSPVIGLSGPTNLTRWGGVGDNVFNIAASGCDCGYLNHGFEYPSNAPDCMERISVEAVWAAVEKILLPSSN